MATNRRLDVSEFDFDNIKANLKVFLKAQTDFKDYDFEGSGMNILLDTLAYNTHYLGYNLNMVANEMFIDSSNLRSSIVSHAKMLGYETDSPRAPYAEVNVVLNDPAKKTATKKPAAKKPAAKKAAAKKPAAKKAAAKKPATKKPAAKKDDK